MGSSTSTADQFAGCLIGQCLGDALGSPVEGQPSEHCRQYARRALGTLADPSRELPDFGGQYTDDSQLARELLSSYAEAGRFDAGDYAARIAAMFRDGRIVGAGRATSEAARRLIQGVAWEAAGTPAPSAGNGSAMRAAPIGLMFWDEPEKMLEAAYDQGRITHLDPRCSAGAVAGAVALALRARSDLDRWHTQLSRWVERHDPALAEGLAVMPALASGSPEEALPVIRGFGQEADYDNGWSGISPFVTGSVLWSLYCFFRHPDDYAATIRTAIAVGGDVDTTAAMAGAISGAYLGLAALPLRLAARLTDQGEWGFEALLALAQRAHAIKHRMPTRHRASSTGLL